LDWVTGVLRPFRTSWLMVGIFLRVFSLIDD
jgi:hypothetical protein